MDIIMVDQDEPNDDGLPKEGQEEPVPHATKGMNLFLSMAILSTVPGLSPSIFTI